MSISEFIELSRVSISARSTCQYEMPHSTAKSPGLNVAIREEHSFRID